MKKYIFIPLVISILSLAFTPFFAAKAVSQTDTPEKLNPTNASSTSEERIKQFLQAQSNTLSQDFPYRINLFSQGQIDKNKAGIRIAETAKQLFADNAGLVFYYELYNHSMRVPHWHANAVESGAVLKGKMRVTIWEGTGKPKIFTVEKYGSWMIPQATLHSLENVGPGELTFFVSYNSPNAADRDFATAWAALPDTILEKSLGLTSDEISVVKKTTINRLSSFDPSAVPEKVDTSSPYSNNFSKINALYSSDLGSIKRIDDTNTPAMQAMALQQTIMKPGTLRMPHWYTKADTLLFIYKGSAFFTLMNNEGKVYNTLVKEGDLIFIPVGTFHGYLNTGKKDLEIYEAFNGSKNLTEITLLNGSQHLSPGTLEGATGLSKESVKKIIQQKSKDYIIEF